MSTPADTKPICQNCRFWDSEFYPESKIPRNYGLCQSKDLTGNPEHERLDDIKLGGLPVRTGKDFGCIHFEKKD